MIASSQPAAFEITRKCLQRMAPKLYRRISYFRNEGRHARVARKLVGRFGSVVLNGPFQGMRYGTASAGSVLNPKLIGCYEAELHPVIEKTLRQNYDTIVDIGCAEGYYAVGLLLRMDQARGVAFDLDPRARQLCRETAVLNGVSERLDILGRCDPGSLNAVLNRRTFVLCDCEGAEVDLMDPVSVPALRSCDLLVEVHDFIKPGTMKALIQHFSSTHRFEIIDQQTREVSHYPQLAFLSQHNRWFAVQEFRPARMQWVIFTAQLT